MQTISSQLKSIQQISKRLKIDLTGCHVETIRAERSFGEVYRLHSDYALPEFGRQKTAVVKFTTRMNGSDLDMGRRESRFYSDILPKMLFDHPQIYQSGRYREESEYILLMEDLGPRYYFPARGHQWGADDIIPVLKTYARLHVQGAEVLEKVSDTSWMFTYHNEQWKPDELFSRYEFLVEKHFWPEIPGIRGLIERTFMERSQLNELPQTILHHDSWQSNVGLPVNPSDRCALVDWGFGGYGASEFDLTYLFLEPYRGSVLLNMEKVVNQYWEERAEFSGFAIKKGDQERRFFMALRSQALALLQVAWHAARYPYPPESLPARTWIRHRQTLPPKLAWLAGA